MAPKTSDSATDLPAGDAGAEQSTPDHAASASPDVPAQTTDPDATDPAPGATDDDTPAGEPATDDAQEFTEADLAKLPKDARRAVTKTFQKLAAERKALEPYTDFLKGLDEDAVGAVTALAKDLGLEIHDPKAAASDAASTDIGEAITKAVKESLGPEFEDLADKLAPAIRAAAELVVDRKAQPLVQQQEQIVRESALRESAAVLEAFGKKHPDWKAHESAMVKLMKRYAPGEGVTEAEYLEDLYHLATRDRSVGEQVKKVVQRMSASATGATREAATVSADKVADRPAGPVSFRQAFDAARAGKRFE